MVLITTMMIRYFCEQETLWQIYAALFTYITIKLALFFRARHRRYKLFEYYSIPCLKTSLFGGNYFSNRSPPARHKNAAILRAKLGKTFGLFMADDPILMSTDLELLRQVFIERSDVFKDRVHLPVETPLVASILFAPAQRWHSFRKTMSPPFANFKVRGEESMQFVENSIRLMLDYIERKFDIAHKGEREKRPAGARIRLNVIDLMKSTALHMISHLAINLPRVEVQEHDKHVKSFDEFLGGFDNILIEIAVLLPGIQPLIQKIADTFQYSVALKLIKESLNSTIDKELKQMGQLEKIPKRQMRLIKMLIKEHHEGKMTRHEVIANCMAILVAGYDTTSTTLTYIFWALAKHSDVQQRLRADLIASGTESQYLDQVIDETMRLYPTVMTFTSRLASETVQLNNKIIIPQGTRVVYNGWIVHRDADYWPEPEKFDPERFGPGTEHHPCAFAPFGLGARKCLGYQLARLQLKMIVCDIILRYKIHLIAPDELDLITYSLFLSKPKDDVLIELERIGLN